MNTGSFVEGWRVEDSCRHDRCAGSFEQLKKVFDQRGEAWSPRVSAEEDPGTASGLFDHLRLEEDVMGSTPGRSPGLAPCVNTLSSLDTLEPIYTERAGACSRGIALARLAQRLNHVVHEPNCVVYGPA